MGLTSEVSLVVNNQVMLKKFDNDEDIISRVQSDIDSVRRVFVDKIRTGERNNAFYNGYQWTLEQQEDHIKQMRIPFVYNEIAPMVNHLIGSQQSTRMDSRVVPREKGDEMAAQLLTMLVKWAEQTNQLEYIETQVFKSALIKGRGVAAVKWNMEDMLYGYPRMLMILYGILILIIQICLMLDGWLGLLRELYWICVNAILRFRKLLGKPANAVCLMNQLSEAIIENTQMV